MSTTQPSADPEPVYVDGYVKKGFEKVKEKFRSHLERDFDRGGSFAAYYKGELVVNIWGGYIEKEANYKWREDTMPCVYSSTKSISAIVISHMVERGLLDYNEKISKYWPEFAQNGKEDITLETYITLKAGLCVLDEPYRARLLVEDPKQMGKLLAQQPPLWTPGTKHGYHAMTFALYLDQIVRRVDPKERSLSQYFQEEIAQPFGIEFYIGLPRELYHRTARACMYEEGSTVDMESMFKDFKGDLDLFQKLLANTNDVPQEKNTAWSNTPDCREIPNGSASGHGTAKELAKFHSILANGGEFEGKRLLSMESIKKHTEPKSVGVDVCCGLDGMWSLGSMVIAAVENDKPILMFGHGGFGGQFAVADLTHKVGMAYVTNHLKATITSSTTEETRWLNFHDVLYECIFEVENMKCNRKVLRSSAEYKEFIDAKK